MQKEFLTSKELAVLLHISIATLKNWRKQGRGCPYIKVGRKILYELSDVKQWLKAHKV